MKFHYNPRKATQAAAYLVRLNGDRMDLWRMLKLIYLFDRFSLIESGSTITGDVLDNLPHGGTPSQIYDNTKPHRDARFKDAVWGEYLSENISNEIRLLQRDFDADELSDFDRAVIEKVWNEFKAFSNRRLYSYVHSLPEFKDPQGRSARVDPEEILRYAKWSDEDIQRADRDAKRELILNQVCK